MSENLPTGGGSLCDCEGGLPKNGGGLAKVGGGLAFSLARGKRNQRKYEGWIQREVDGVGDLSETDDDESEYGEEDYGHDQLELGFAYE